MTSPRVRSTRSSGRTGLLLVAAGVVLADQATKVLAVALFADAPARRGPLTLTVAHNTGGPFGVLPGSSAAWTGLTAFLLVTAVVVIGRRPPSALVGVAAGLVIGGGSGNLVDRLVRDPGVGQGGVIDWILLEPYPKVFNLADVAIRGGAIALLVVLALDRSTASGPPVDSRE